MCTHRPLLDQFRLQGGHLRLGNDGGGGVADEVPHQGAHADAEGLTVRGNGLLEPALVQGREFAGAHQAAKAAVDGRAQFLPVGAGGTEHDGEGFDREVGPGDAPGLGRTQSRAHAVQHGVVLDEGIGLAAVEQVECLLPAAEGARGHAAQNRWRRPTARAEAFWPAEAGRPASVASKVKPPVR